MLRTKVGFGIYIHSQNFEQTNLKITILQAKVYHLGSYMVL